MPYTLPYTEVDGTTASGAQTQANFTALLNAINTTVSQGIAGPAVINQVTSRGALAAVGSPAVGMSRYLTEAGREGMFVFSTSNLSALVSTDPQQGVYVAPASDPTGASGAWVRKTAPVTILTPEMFGALGYPMSANDTLAFQKLAAVINYLGGGTVELYPGRTYIVGIQTLVNDGTWMYLGQTIFSLNALSSPFILRGNGAIIKLFSGYRFGTFNSSGAATYNTMPYYGVGQTATPVNGNNYEGIVTINNCTAPVVIENLEIDGNCTNANVGGQKGDTGWQIAGDGLLMFNNHGGEIITNVYTHDCPRDGTIISNTDATGTLKVNSVRSRWTNLHSYHNVRQGLSMGGGRNYEFVHCNFHGTGRPINTTIGGSNIFYSAPGAGVDIEAEFGPIRDIVFKLCSFGDCVGAAFVSDSGDTEGLVFEDCNFYGGGSWCAWFNKPYIKAYRCKFYGALTHAFGDATIPGRAVQFHDCSFSDSAAGTPYTSVGSPTMLLNFNASGANVFFRKCVFNASVGLGNGDGHIFEGCYSSTSNSFPTNCRFDGRNVALGIQPGGLGIWVTNPRGLGFSFTDGGVTYTEWANNQASYTLPIIAAGATTTTTIKILGCYVGDKVDVTFDALPTGIIARGEVTTPGGSFTAGTITVTFENKNASASVAVTGTLRVGITSARAIS